MYALEPAPVRYAVLFIVSDFNIVCRYVTPLIKVTVACTALHVCHLLA